MNPAWIHRLAVAATLALMATGNDWAQERIRIAGNFNDKHSSSIAIEQFKKDVEAGTIIMTWVGMAFLFRTVPELEAVSLPFLFPSREVAYKVMDGPIGDLLDKKLEDRNFIALGFMELGSGQVFTR